MEQMIQNILHDSSKMIFVVISFMILSEGLVALILYLRIKSFLSHARKVTADIIHIEKNPVNRGGKHDQLSISFKDRFGNQVTPPQILLKTAMKYQVGDKIDIFSDNNNPEIIKLAHFRSLYLLPMAFILGCTSSLMVLVILVMSNMAKIPL
jgi:hypothetical protein